MTNRNKPSTAQAAGVAAILLPGGIGVWIVARTLSAYWGRDWLASLIVVSIGMALILGLVELFVRQMRAEVIERELRALPSKPTESTLDMASPLVASMLRARIEQAPLPNLGETMAPYLTGFLVMLGLLGTLLGLFQTVHGAGHALTSSADVDELRRSLSAPIDGLTRSFGCSAAGISASAMLGLALALVRRREASVMRVFHMYAAGPLRALSPFRRQTLALEQLASASQQGLSGANEGVGAKLEAVTQQLIALQQTALKTQERVFNELLAKSQAEMGKAANAVGDTLNTRLSPLLEQMATRSSEALTAQAGALAQGARELTRVLESDATQRRKDAAEAMEAMRTRLDEAENARAAKQAEPLQAVLSLATRAAEESGRRESALSERWQELSEHFEAQLSAARDSEGGRLTQLDTLSTRVGSELERLSGALAAELEQRRSSERDHDERLGRVLSQLEAAAGALESNGERQATMLEQSVARQEHAISQLVERVPNRLEEAAENSRQAAQSTLDKLAALTEERLTRVVTLLSDELGQRSEQTHAFDQRTAQALDRAEQTVTLLDGAITQAVTRQSEGLEALLQRVNTLLPELADAAQTGAAHTLARMQESADQQAVRFADLEAAISRGRNEHASELASQLTSHASELEARLVQAGVTVQEAAGVWQAASAEMQAVAELFASSVERQREASDAWLESLGEVEGAVERAGRDAARDALTDQLSSTQEVFARQLQFQRELFEQLRTLRSLQTEGGAADHTHQEEHQGQGAA